MRGAMYAACMGEMGNACETFIGKPEGKRPLRWLRHRWDDNIRMNLRVIGWDCVAGCIWLRIGTSGRFL